MAHLPTNRPRKPPTIQKLLVIGVANAVALQVFALCMQMLNLMLTCAVDVVADAVYAEVWLLLH